MIIAREARPIIGACRTVKGLRRLSKSTYCLRLGADFRTGFLEERSIQPSVDFLEAKGTGKGRRR